MRIMGRTAATPVATMVETPVTTTAVFLHQVAAKSVMILAATMVAVCLHQAVEKQAVAVCPHQAEKGSLSKPQKEAKEQNILKILNILKIYRGAV